LWVEVGGVSRRALEAVGGGQALEVVVERRGLEVVGLGGVGKRRKRVGCLGVIEVGRALSLRCVLKSL
jgi:hypothetical protein